MRRRLLPLAGLLLLAALAVTAAGAARPKAFLARYHLSAYGVYHRTYYEDSKAAPCQVGGKGGGFDGMRKHTEAIRWQTVAPATALVARVLPSLPPTISILRSRNVVG